MATDTLEIFGTEYTNVKGLVATDDNDTEQTYIRPQGTKSISANGVGIDVTEYAAVDVAVPSEAPTLQTKTKTYTPTESQQTESITADVGYDGLEEVDVTVGAISSTYVGTGITRRSSADLSVSGDTVTAPSGYYQNNASKAVASGTAGTPTATKGAVSNHSISVTPSVTNSTGYITGSTKTGTAVTVSASELVSGSETKTQNGTYDVTNLASLIVNVSGGGGGGWTNIHSSESEVNTSSTTAATAVTLNLGSTYYTDSKILYVRVRDKSGPRNGYFYGSDAFFMNFNKANGATTTLTVAALETYRYNNSVFTGYAGQYGVYGYSLSSSGSLIIRRRYNSTYTLTINSTYKIDVYTIDPPLGLWI